MIKKSFTKNSKPVFNLQSHRPDVALTMRYADWQLNVYMPWLKKQAGIRS